MVFVFVSPGREDISCGPDTKGKYSLTKGNIEKLPFSASAWPQTSRLTGLAAAEIETWLMAPTDEAVKLQKPVLDDAIKLKPEETKSA